MSHEDQVRAFIEHGRIPVKWKDPAPPNVLPPDPALVKLAEFERTEPLKRADYAEMTRKYFAAEARVEALSEALQVILDCIDWTQKKCWLNDPVSGVLPRVAIEKAHAALAKAKGTP